MENSTMQNKIITYISFSLFIIVFFLYVGGIIKLDKYSFVLVVLFAVPFIATYLESLNIFGNHFNFRKSIDKIEDYTIKATEESKKQTQDNINKTYNEYPIAFSTEQSRELIEKDSTLALAALRIEIEKSLKVFCNKLKIGNSEKVPLNKIVNGLNEIKVLNDYQANALKEIIFASNKAIHGKNISDNDAREIIDLAEQLSRSFAIGYVPNFNKNLDYKKQGLICEWEHCIEYQPLKPNRDEESCKIFGHDCPGGKETCVNCKKEISDLADRL